MLRSDTIAAAALDFINQHGSSALTMRSLASALEVSPRALYQHVAGRSELIGLAAATAMADWPHPPLDADQWQESVRVLMREVRGWHRRYPRLLDLVRDEGVAFAVPPEPLVGTEEMHRLFLTIGLSPDHAYHVGASLLLSTTGFVAFQDAITDRPPPGYDPSEWGIISRPLMASHPQLDLWASETINEQATWLDADALFETVIDTVIAGIAARLPLR